MPDLLHHLALILNLVEIIDNLPLCFNQIMVSFVQLQTELNNNTPQLFIGGNFKKRQFLPIQQLLCLLDQGTDIFPFLVVVFQLVDFNFVGWLSFESVLNITVQIDNITQRHQPDFP